MPEPSENGPQYSISENEAPYWTFTETSFNLDPSDPATLSWNLTPSDYVEDPDDDDEISVAVELGEASILFKYDEGRLSVRTSTIESFYDSILAVFPTNSTSIELTAFDNSKAETSQTLFFNFDLQSNSNVTENTTIEPNVTENSNSDTGGSSLSLG